MMSEVDMSELPPELPLEQADVRIRCRAKSGLTADLLVRDISLGGCMVECADWSAHPGERVLVILPGLDWQPTRLVWMEDGLAGLAFEQLLYEPLASHLQQLIVCAGQGRGINPALTMKANGSLSSMVKAG